MPRPVFRTTFVGAFVMAAFMATAVISDRALASVEGGTPISIDVTEFLAISAPKSVSSETQTDKTNGVSSRYVTLIIGGDLGFGGSGQLVSPIAGLRNGRRVRYADLTRKLEGVLQGSDLAFANLETVVTEKNTLYATDKKFNFRMHPNGVAHLIDAGFNLLSTANNHAIDYGTSGMRHTLKHLEALRQEGLLAAHGVAASSLNLFRPAKFSKNNNRFALSAVGIGGIRARLDAPGQVHFRSIEDVRRITDGLRQTKASYRMLSVHYGQELQVRPSSKDRKRLVSMTNGLGGVDLVIGHHAHTPAGVQRIGDRLVFFGLGNLLHLGMQDMGKHNECRDFGMLAKLHLLPITGTDGRLTARAIELYTLRDMHLVSKVRGGSDGQRRINVVNYLSAELDDDADTRVQFVARKDGTGLYCAPGAKELGGPVGALCRNWRRPPPLDASTKRKLRHACRYMRKGSTPGRVATLRRSKAPSKSKKSGIPSFARSIFYPQN